MMKRGYLVAQGLAAGVAAVAVLCRGPIAAMIGRLGVGAGAPQAQQWPFDQDELRTLMDRTLEEQRAIIANADDPADRARAEAFARYYEGRRATALGIVGSQA